MTWTPRGLGHRPDRRQRMGAAPYLLASEHLGVDALPPAASSVDLRARCVVLDQGSAGTCVTHSTVQIARLDHLRQGIADPAMISRHVHYAQASAIQGNFGQDLGLEPRIAWQAISTLGFVREADAPYSDSDLWSGIGPELETGAYPQRDVANVEDLVVEGATDGATLDLIRRLLTSERGVSWGGPVSNAFCQNALDWSKPIGPMTKDIAGGHEMVLCGYQPGGNVFLVWNSWGSGFGLGSFFLMTADAVLADVDRHTAWQMPYFQEAA